MWMGVGMGVGVWVWMCVGMGVGVDVYGGGGGCVYECMSVDVAGCGSGCGCVYECTSLDVGGWMDVGHESSFIIIAKLAHTHIQMYIHMNARTQRREYYTYPRLDTVFCWRSPYT